MSPAPAMDANAYGASKRNGYDYTPTKSPTTGGTNTPQTGSNGQTGSNTGSNTGTQTGTQTGTTTTGSGTTEVPKGSQYFRPSYGQKMDRGVKAPYKTGGYTEDELRGFGNAPRTDIAYNGGKPVYEGYYLAPNGNYYPVDQGKANYYRKYGTYYGYNDYKNGYSSRSYGGSRGG